jgi:hypothetical protein
MLPAAHVSFLNSEEGCAANAEAASFLEERVLNSPETDAGSRGGQSVRSGTTTVIAVSGRGGGKDANEVTGYEGGHGLEHEGRGNRIPLLHDSECREQEQRDGILSGRLLFTSP